MLLFLKTGPSVLLNLIRNANNITASYLIYKKPGHLRDDVGYAVFVGVWGRRWRWALRVCVSYGGLRVSSVVNTGAFCMMPCFK